MDATPTLLARLIIAGLHLAAALLLYWRLIEDAPAPERRRAFIPGLLLICGLAALLLGELGAWIGGACLALALGLTLAQRPPVSG